MSGIPSEKRRHCKQRLGHFCSTRRVRALAFCALVFCTCSTMLDDVRNAGKKPAEPENVTIKSYSVGDVLLADGTIVPYNAEDLTFTDDQKKNAVGVLYSVDENYKTGWYMPSLAELCYVYRNIALLNKVIKALGGVELTDDFYWSSSQSEHDYFAWGVSFLGGYVFDGYSKGDCFYVCCVRSFSK